MRLARSLTYTSMVDGRTRAVPHRILVTHMFQHQARLRGQVTTLLSQPGFDVGTTDPPFMARFEVRVAARRSGGSSLFRDAQARGRGARTAAR
jgi:uncharacterized damage-inducible protein DinB